ncbi:membrane protein [Robiginitalea biformata]|uniref:DUF4870 domain-containing protein n=1 Tax=Robiginitalea biformata (strain ATCC BAA-864 / DSM 15991 / KCTC 12146 / HTCC2501) TaxID=313596 RepID=A4CLI7_ROBBH|nr:membrane protein [Robiginitalea biformata]EAR15736.1 hypothetical protein RB2501_15449 [Robiginitalea biformata HTCC2501]
MARPPKQARTIAVVAYLTLVGALISISMNAEPKYPFGRFHARQAFGLHLAFILSALLISLVFELFNQMSFFVFSSVWFALYAGYFVLWIYGFVAALQGSQRLVPLVGRAFQRWFTFIS